MTTTFKNLIEEVEGYLYSYGMQRDKVTTLLAGISSQTTSLVVEDARQIDRGGFIEIDQELMAVNSASADSGTVTLHPWGRGERGTTPAAHAEGAKIVASPRFPRSTIAASIKRTVASMYPDLYQVRVDETSLYSAGRAAYELPYDADSVISVSYELPGPSREWQRISRYRVDNNANPEDFSTGKSITFHQYILPGRPIRIAYRAGFGEFQGENDSLEAIGLQSRWADLIVYGAAGNLVLSMEPSRLQSDAVETQERAEGVQPTQATAVSRQLLGMFKQRIMEERALLHRKHPAVVVRQF